MKAFSERTITIDCDVLQADGGTRTASITGGCVALCDALAHLRRKGVLATDPLLHLVGSVSAGIYQGAAILDLDYIEDSNADTDMNFVMNEAGGFIEIQGTAERNTFSGQQLQARTELAQAGVRELIANQRQALGMA